MKYIPPAIDKTAFNCPHCGVLTTQYWSCIWREDLEKSSTPRVINEEESDELINSFKGDLSNKEKLERLVRKLATGNIFSNKAENARYLYFEVRNLHCASCMECSKFSVWVHDRMIYPVLGQAPPANPDLPDDIRRDYDEASSILDLSPRGAAALLRLAIQKLCNELGDPGKSINQNIADLVEGGLGKEIQEALDSVRVIGNEAVHPGEMDLKDDRATVETLFMLVNYIATTMISDKRVRDEIFASLPQKKLDGIKNRDRPK